MIINKAKNKTITKIAALAILSTTVISSEPMITYALENEVVVQSNIEMQKMGKIISCSSLNVRSGPGVSNKVVTKVYRNNSVKILETHSNGWHKIQTANGTIGWSSGKYISVYNSNQSNVENNTSNQSNITKLLTVAHQQLGKPYKWGGNGPSSFDCSGFTLYVYKNGAGITLPRISRDQARYGQGISRNNIQPGDIVCFNSGGSSRVNHVGIYIGEDKFIHSPSSGGVVRIESLSKSNFSRRLVQIRRVL